ncbi:CRISPR-associated helicase Cas3' [Arsenophonus nasoniae]|uniref:CRISPR-associated helicase Cas3' n=1 Tax=Arsenophonus nasoniae TaxID=638 RepID=UPI00387922BA
MYVTFISQCEKKALARTRRVLDAFADRIGNNTWQTVITEDGLIAVKKLLRKTVSKNTAVSCHWIRSRQRSELLWIVGNRNKFNLQGIVPVNTTQKEVFMDIAINQVKKDEHYANTQLLPLAEHSFAVGYIAQQLFNQLVDNNEHRNLAKVAYLAGCLHDIGKLDLLFQQWVKKGKQKDPTEDGQHIDVKFTFEKHPRHNEISLLIFNVLEQQITGLYNHQKENLHHVIYWHHAKPYRPNGDFDSLTKAYSYLLKNITAEQFEKLINDTLSLLKQIVKLSKNYNNVHDIEKNLNLSFDYTPALRENFEYQIKDKEFPKFKRYETTDSVAIDKLKQNINKNAHHNLLRACVISADRLISQLTASDLLDYVHQQRLDELLIDSQEMLSNLPSHLTQIATKFPTSERSQKQLEIAQKLADLPDIAVLAGPAGCGKTQIALQWAKLKDAKQIIWVCPRVQICQGIFQELIDTYLPDAKIEIYTSEFKYTNSWGEATDEQAYFSGDVVVTTIDQILNSIVTHTKVNSLLPFMGSHVVFDEYHEYMTMEIFNLLFAELIANKRMREKYNKNTLLVSATPPYLYLRDIIGLHENDVIEMASFNQSNYQINFIEYNDESIDDNPFYKKYSDNTFVISNTAQTAQLSFIHQKNNENALLFHSKFKRSDKKYWFNQVYESFKKQGSGKYDVLRSGPIVQASLNISCDFMLSEMTSPENLLQRIGRLNRFGENQQGNIIKIAITPSVKQGKCIGKSAYFLNRLNSLQTSKAWYEYLQDKLANQQFKLTQLYQLHKTFYSSTNGIKSATADLAKALQNSIMLTNSKVTEPTKIVKTKTPQRNAKMSKTSLRGDSRFIQLAVLDINDYQQPKFENFYAYQPPLDDTTEFDNLTESLTAIKDSGLLDFIAQKHGNIDKTHPVKGIPAKKNQARCKVLENYSRDAEYPLYLSYIEDDLNKVGDTSVRHPEAIYYATCDKQPIGTISLQKLQILTINKEGK